MIYFIWWVSFCFDVLRWIHPIDFNGLSILVSHVTTNGPRSTSLFTCQQLVTCMSKSIRSTHSRSLDDMLRNGYQLLWHNTRILKRFFHREYNAQECFNFSFFHYPNRVTSSSTTERRTDGTTSLTSPRTKRRPQVRPDRLGTQTSSGRIRRTVSKETEGLLSRTITTSLLSKGEEEDKCNLVGSQRSW